MQERRKAFKAMLEAPEILVLPGIFNGFSARLVEKSGFKAGAITGAGVSENFLGWADRGILSYQDNLTVCRNLAACVSIPLLADADTGYGNALNVRFVVQGFESAGLAALSIEDQTWPKRCGHMSGKSVIPAAEMVQKIKAAVDARTDENFLIRARTDAAATDGIAEVVDRLGMYAEAGADILYADALMTVDDIRTVAQHARKPLGVNMGFGLIPRKTTPLLTPKQLQALGVATVSYARMLPSAALRGLMNGMAAFKKNLDADEPIMFPDLMVTFEEVNELMGDEELTRLEEKYTS